MTWKKHGKKARETPKWLPRETSVTVLLKHEPKEQEIDGKWGKRQVFLIETAEYGQVYLSPTMFASVASKIMELPEEADSFKVTI